MRPIHRTIYLSPYMHLYAIDIVYLSCACVATNIVRRIIDAWACGVCLDIGARLRLPSYLHN